MSLGTFALLTQLYPEHSCFLLHKWLRYRLESLLVVLALDVLFSVIPYITVLYLGGGDKDAVEEEWLGFGFRSSLVDILALMFLRAISSLWGYNRFNETWRCIHLAYLSICAFYIVVKMCTFDYENWLYTPVSILIASSSLFWCVIGIYISSVLSPTRQSVNLTKVNSTRPFSFIEVERYSASTPIRIMVDSSDGLSEIFYTPTEGSTPEKDHSFHHNPHSSDLHFVTPPESMNASSVNPVDSCEMLISTWKQKMEHAKDLFGKARILAASYVVHQIEAAFNFHQNELLENHPIERISILQSLSSPFCRTLFTEENTVRKLISTFENGDGWVSFQENDTSHMWFQSTQNVPTYSYKIEGTINASLINVLSVCFELDLCTEWLPKYRDYGLVVCHFPLESRELSRPAKVTKIVYLDFSLPWPFVNRDFVVIEKATDVMLEMGHIMLTLKSVKNFPGVQIPYFPRSEKIRAECNFGGFLLTPLSEQETLVRMIVNFDPKMSYVPYWLANWAIRRNIHNIFHHLKYQAEDTTFSEHQVRAESSHGMYEDIKQEVSSILQKKMLYPRRR